MTTISSRSPSIRRALVVLVAVLAVGTACSGPSSGAGPAPSGAAAPADPARAEAVMRVVESVRASAHLKAVIVRVTIDGRDVVTRAVGESMAGVPATTDMHFRNGAVAISYVATLLLQLVDEGRVRLDDPVSRWLPDLPSGDRVTLGQLARMTAGYADYVTTPELTERQYAEPFRTFTPEELVAIGTSRPLLYPPGTNWNYSHTDYVILGLALERITGQPVSTLLQDKALRPLGLDRTGDPGNPTIPEPALHTYTSERRQFLGVPADIPFSEESTSWNPSWTITRGAVQTTTIGDLSATAAGIGSGQLLSPPSYRAMLSRDLIGRTTALPGCTTCIPQSANYTYGLGLVSTGNWVMQNPLFSGGAGAFGYLPSRRVAVAVAVTFEPAAFDPVTGEYRNAADILWRKIAAELVPDDAPPIPPGA